MHACIAINKHGNAYTVAYIQEREREREREREGGEKRVFVGALIIKHS